jgi:restriction endonuclease, S subunit
MSEWPMVKLGEYCDVIMGQAPKGIDVNEDLMGLPLIAGAGDFSSTGVEVSKWTEKPTKTCIINDIILSVRATVGTYRFADRDYCLGRGVAALRAKDNLDQKYLSFVIDFYRTKLLSVARGATFLQISKADIGTLMIPLPPLGEQKRIAEILGRVAEAEQHVQDTLELLDEVAKSSFYTFCGIPDHFERRKKLGEIAIVATGNTPPRKDPSNYGSYIEWIKSDNLGSIFPTPASEFLSEEGLKRGRVAAPGSLLMTCIAGSIKSIGKCSVVNRKVAFNQQINSIKPVNNEDLYYLYLLFYVAPYLVQRRSTGGLKGIVKKSSLEMCEIPWPERKVRQMIGTFCQEWINCHLLVMRKLSLLQELQKSLANRAFAGLL